MDDDLYTLPAAKRSRQLQHSSHTFVLVAVLCMTFHDDVARYTYRSVAYTWHVTIHPIGCRHYVAYLSSIGAVFLRARRKLGPVQNPDVSVSACWAFAGYREGSASSSCSAAQLRADDGGVDGWIWAGQWPRGDARIQASRWSRKRDVLVSESSTELASLFLFQSMSSDLWVNLLVKLGLN